MTPVLFIHQVVESQDIHVKASIEESKIVSRHQFNIPLFQELVGFISNYALTKIFQEFKRFKASEFSLENCRCELRTSYGLPCAHEQAMYFSAGQPIPLDLVDIFWKKLDLLPCRSLGDSDIGCEVELQMFHEQFKKKSRSGKFSYLRKLKEIIAPSTTTINEPTMHKTTHGRPSIKRTRVKKPPQTQETRRHSCSSATRIFGQEFFEYQEPIATDDIWEKYHMNPYIDQLPNMCHSYITHVQDVNPDGNCGFRAIAMCHGLHEDEWVQVRKDLMEELNMYRTGYNNMFGHQQFLNVYHILNFFDKLRAAPYEHWMAMPEIGFLIASRYNVILHVLYIAGSLTYLPLWSSPPACLNEHIAIAIGFVNKKHFVKVALFGEYPVPTIMPQWVLF